MGDIKYYIIAFIFSPIALILAIRHRVKYGKPDYEETPGY
jgi:hypothetical protein